MTVLVWMLATLAGVFVSECWRCWRAGLPVWSWRSGVLAVWLWHALADGTWLCRCGHSVEYRARGLKW